MPGAVPGSLGDAAFEIRLADDQAMGVLLAAGGIGLAFAGGQVAADDGEFAGFAGIAVITGGAQWVSNAGAVGTGVACLVAAHATGQFGADGAALVVVGKCAPAQSAFIDDAGEGLREERVLVQKAAAVAIGVGDGGQASTGVVRVAKGTRIRQGDGDQALGVVVAKGQGAAKGVADAAQKPGVVVGVGIDEAAALSALLQQTIGAEGESCVYVRACVLPCAVVSLGEGIGAVGGAPDTSAHRLCENTLCAIRAGNGCDRRRFGSCVSHQVGERPAVVMRPSRPHVLQPCKRGCGRVAAIETLETQCGRPCVAPIEFIAEFLLGGGEYRIPRKGAVNLAAANHRGKRSFANRGTVGQLRNRCTVSATPCADRRLVIERPVVAAGAAWLKMDGERSVDRRSGCTALPHPSICICAAGKHPPILVSAEFVEADVGPRCAAIVLLARCINCFECSVIGAIFNGGRCDVGNVERT